MEKQIVVAHGDKGGVGKSLYSMLMIDYALDKGQPVVLIEGDKNISDVARRFAGVDGVTTIKVDLDASGIDAEASINKLFTEIESAGGDFFVLNTPANSSKSIDIHTDQFMFACDELGYSLRLAWMVGTGQESAILANQSQLAAAADRRIAVVNRGLAPGADDSHFYWLSTQGEPERTQWLEAGGIEGELLTLLSRVKTQVDNLPGPFQSLTLRSSPLNVISRSGLWRWLQAARENAVAPLVEI